eukprot:2553967-Prymnesium_polylepis.1
MAAPCRAGQTRRRPPASASDGRRGIDRPRPSRRHGVTPRRSRTPTPSSRGTRRQNRSPSSRPPRSSATEATGRAAMAVSSSTGIARSDRAAGGACR